MNQHNDSSKELDETIRADRQNFTNSEEKVNKPKDSAPGLQKPKMTKRLLINAELVKMEERDKLDPFKTAEEHKFDERIYRLLDCRDVLAEADYEALSDSEKTAFEDKQREALSSLYSSVTIQSKDGEVKVTRVK